MTETLKHHKIMTREEYDALNLQGWHCVNHTAEPGATYLMYGLPDARPTPTVEGGELMERLDNAVRTLVWRQHVSDAIAVSQAKQALASRDAEIERLRGELANSGDEYLEFKEALDDLRALRAECECLNGGGPRWAERNAEAWRRVDELFAHEDEAAWDRQQEDAHG